MLLCRSFRMLAFLAMTASLFGLEARAAEPENGHSGGKMLLGSPGEKAQVSLFGVKAEGSKFVYVLDRSGSTDGKIAGRGQGRNPGQHRKDRRRAPVPTRGLQRASQGIQSGGAQRPVGFRHRCQSGGGQEVPRHHRGRWRHRSRRRLVAGHPHAARRDLSPHRRRQAVAQHPGVGPHRSHRAGDHDPHDPVRRGTATLAAVAGWGNSPSKAAASTSTSIRRNWKPDKG